MDIPINKDGDIDYDNISGDDIIVSDESGNKTYFKKITKIYDGALYD